MIAPYLKYVILLAVLIVVQDSFIWLIAISKYNIAPDLVIIVIIYIGIKNGQIEGMVFGFFSGIILDFLSGSFIGLSALSYSIAGFIGGYFKRDISEPRYRMTSMLGIIFLCTLISYSIFYSIYFQGTMMPFTEIFIKHIITTAVYTTVFALIFVIIFNTLEERRIL